MSRRQDTAKTTISVINDAISMWMRRKIMEEMRIYISASKLTILIERCQIQGFLQHEPLTIFLVCQLVLFLTFVTGYVHAPDCMFRRDSSFASSALTMWSPKFQAWLQFRDRTNLSRNTTKPTKWHVRPAKTQISLGIRPVWSESSLSTWRKLGSLATHWAHSEDSDQTGRMPRLIRVFAVRTLILLALSCRGSLDTAFAEGGVSGQTLDTACLCIWGP